SHGDIPCILQAQWSHPRGLLSSIRRSNVSLSVDIKGTAYDVEDDGRGEAHVDGTIQATDPTTRRDARDLRGPHPPEDQHQQGHRTLQDHRGDQQTETDCKVRVALRVEEVHEIHGVLGQQCYLKYQQWTAQLMRNQGFYGLIRPLPNIGKKNLIMLKIYF